MAGTSKNPSSNSGKSNGAPGAALVYIKCGYTVCQFAHASGVTPPRPHVSHPPFMCAPHALINCERTGKAWNRGYSIGIG